MLALNRNGTFGRADKTMQAKRAGTTPISPPQADSTTASMRS